MVARDEVGARSGRARLVSAIVAVTLSTIVALANDSPTASADSAAKLEVRLRQPPEEGGRDFGVMAECTFEVGSTGSLTLTCKFRNLTAQAKRFVLCFMVDLKEDEMKPVPAISPGSQKWFVLEQVTEEGGQRKLRCRERGPTGVPKTSYVLGCKLVVLEAREDSMDRQVWRSPPGLDYLPPPGTDAQAHRFQVRYADLIDITGEPGKTFDEASCSSVVGQGMNLAPDRELKVGAQWVVHYEPFEDPYIGYQRRLGRAPPRSYAPFAHTPCVPYRLPEKRAPYAVCPRPIGPPPPNIVDLNLFWFRSMAPDVGPETVFPAVLRVSATGATEGVRILTDPPAGRPFVILGQDSRYGRLAACSTSSTALDECRSPKVPEGVRVDVTVDIFDLTERFLFDQQGVFIQDRRPPVVRAFDVRRFRTGTRFTVEARDTTTSPLAATLWYTLDRGRRWRAVDLEPASSLLEDAPARRFGGFVPALTPRVRANARVYIAVQDEVFNVTWFGPRNLR